MTIARMLVAAAVILVACSPGAGTGEDLSGSLLVTGADGGVTLVDREGVQVAAVEESPAAGIGAQPTSDPTGIRVAYTTLRDTGPAARIWASDGTSDIAVPIAPFYYAWSPSGEHLVALGNGTAGVAGVLIDVDDGSVTALGESTPFFVAWSPDGDALAAYRDGTDLEVIDTEGSARRIPVEVAPFQAPDWKDPDNLLAAVLDSSIDVSLTPVQAQTARVASVALDDGSVGPGPDVAGFTTFTHSPQSGATAIIDGSAGGGLLVGRLRVETQRGELVTVAESDVVTAEWDPAGDRLLVGLLEPPLIVPAVWDGESIRRFPGLQPTLLFVRDYLPFWSQYVRSLTTWAPDGSAFAYASSHTGSDRVFIQGLDGSEPRDVVAGSFVSWVG